MRHVNHVLKILWMRPVLVVISVCMISLRGGAGDHILCLLLVYSADCDVVRAETLSCAVAVVLSSQSDCGIIFSCSSSGPSLSTATYYLCYPNPQSDVPNSTLLPFAHAAACTVCTACIVVRTECALSLLCYVDTSCSQAVLPVQLS